MISIFNLKNQAYESFVEISQGATTVEKFKNIGRYIISNIWPKLCKNLGGNLSGPGALEGAI